MKVLCISNTKVLSGTAHVGDCLARLLKGLGIDVQLVGIEDMGLPGLVGNPDHHKLWGFLNYVSMVRGARALNDSAKRRRIKKFLLSSDFDIILCINYFPGLLELAKEAGAKTVLWGMDDPQPFSDEWFDFARQCDYVFTKSFGALPAYKERGQTSVEWLPLAYDDARFYPRPLRKLYPLSFVGSYAGAGRASAYSELLFPLIARFGRSLHLFGSGWDRCGEASKACVDGYVPRSRVPSVYCTSKITINAHRELDRTMEGSFNFRVFEALGSGCFLLCDNVPGLDLLFDLKRDLCVASDPKEAVEMAEYYLLRDDERERMAKSGYDKARSQHTFYHRARRIAEVFKTL